MTGVQACALPIYRRNDGKLHVVTFDPALEDYVNNAVEHSDRGSYVTLGPDILASITEKAASRIERLVVKGYSPIVLCAPQVRAHVKKIGRASCRESV